MRVCAGPDDTLTTRDRLRPGARRIVTPPPDDPADPQHAVELVRLGFLDAVLPPAARPIADAPADADDPMFWQFPARTEAAALLQHAKLTDAVLHGSDVHVYLGLPWATWIDLANRRGATPEIVDRELLMQRVRIGGFRRVLRALGANLRVHSVCQHLAWRPWVPAWQALGITDMWLSHAPAADVAASVGELRLHPWHLYAVNVEDAARRKGIDAGRDPADRKLLASFVGAHEEHYLSDVRLRLRALAAVDGFHVEVTGKWHFDEVVHGHQIEGKAPAAGGDASVQRYNAVLSDSVFSLCPAGAGANTLRLWESLAVGAVPVLFDRAPRMPEGGTLEPIDWDSIVVRVADERIGDLPRILRALPIDEVRRRQQLGMQAYARVREQRCF